MNNAVIVAAKRTPIGKKDGLFKGVQPEKLAAPLLKHLAAGIETHVQDVILGNVVGPGGNLARLTSLEAGLPVSVPGLTIDRQCSAGLEAIRLASYLVQSGAGDCYIAGGVESESTSPYKKRSRFSPDRIGDPDMGEAAENVASNYQITRQKQDDYACLSYHRSWKAHDKGYFTTEILPVEDQDQDEAFNKKRPIDQLVVRAKPAFKTGGTVTAANSCGINDGASAVLVMSEAKAATLGYVPVLRFVDSAVAGVHPFYPGIAPVPAIQVILERQSLAVSDIDIFELNEAFASKIVACVNELKIPYEKLNPHGGALTLGHPYGASGSILVTRLFHEAHRSKDLKFVMAAIGSGGGIGLAVLFEAI